MQRLSRNTNASAMALSGNTVYLAKAHANGNGKMVYKSMIFKSSQFVSDTIGDNEKISEINYFVFGMAATADRLYCTCKDETGDSGILEMKFDTSGRKFTKLNTTYVGIDIYKNDEFILMEELNRATPETMKFITGNLNEVQNGRGTKFTVIANEADEYQKANDIHYDSNQGLFILTNHYPDDTQKYSQCKNRKTMKIIKFIIHMQYSRQTKILLLISSLILRGSFSIKIIYGYFLMRLRHLIKRSMTVFHICRVLHLKSGMRM